jgi:hypothetical protein
LGRERSTVHSYRSIARTVSTELGRVQLTKLRADQLDRVYAALLRSGRSAATVQRHHAFIRRSLAQAKRWDWVRENVAERASPPREPRRRFEVQSADAVFALIEAPWRSAVKALEGLSQAHASRSATPGAPDEHLLASSPEEKASHAAPQGALMGRRSPWRSLARTSGSAAASMPVQANAVAAWMSAASG